MIAKNLTTLINLTFLALCFDNTAHADVPFRWTNNYVQGNVLADIQVKGGDILEFSCNQGGETQNAAQNLFVSYSVNPSNKNNPASSIRGQDTLQFIIDGKTYLLPGDGLYLASGALNTYGNLNSFLLIQEALMNAKQQYFQFQIPEANFSVDISTAGAKEAIAPTWGCK
jgi:hypothetical protein